MRTPVALGDAETDTDAISEGSGLGTNVGVDSDVDCKNMIANTQTRQWYGRISNCKSRVSPNSFGERGTQAVRGLPRRFSSTKLAVLSQIRKYAGGILTDHSVQLDYRSTT